MSREWKSGDVALVSSWRGADLVGIRVLPRSADDPLTWCIYERGDTRGLSDNEVTSARPLVVIDPEDREQVERLESLYLADDHDACENPTDCMADALREFANPTPPKPDEPTGLGAVVEDDEGVKWIRLGLADDALFWPWGRVGNIGGGASNWVKYADITAARVLSEGVSDV